jgi:hypothetical protein
VDVRDSRTEISVDFIINSNTKELFDSIAIKNSSKTIAILDYCCKNHPSWVMITPIIAIIAPNMKNSLGRALNRKYAITVVKTG